MISSYGSLLVTLQRPPEIFSFRPRPFSFQLIKLIYFSLAATAAIALGPPPITIV